MVIVKALLQVFHATEVQSPDWLMHIDAPYSAVVAAKFTMDHGQAIHRTAAIHVTTHNNAHRQSFPNVVSFSDCSNHSLAFVTETMAPMDMNASTTVEDVTIAGMLVMRLSTKAVK